MRREDVLKVLHEKPFRPFRLKLTDGEAREVRHPELCMPSLGAVVLGVASPGSKVADDYEIVSLIHIVRIEYVNPPDDESGDQAPTASNGTPTP